MIAITGQWIGDLQPLFISIPEIAALLPWVQKDHEALLMARAGSSAEGLLRTLSDTANGLDERHDHLQRALNFILLGAREALLGLDPANSALEDQIEAAQDQLLPRGLEIITSSYEAEAGNAAQMVRIADTELADILRQIPVIQGMNALDLVRRIGEVGEALGRVEHQKSMTEAAAKKEIIAPAEVRRRMRVWADTVEAVLGALTRTEAPEDAVLSIQKPVQDAAEKARVRRLAQRHAAAKKAAAAGEKSAAAGGEKPAAAGGEKPAAAGGEKPAAAGGEKPAAPAAAGGEKPAARGGGGEPTG